MPRATRVEDQAACMLVLIGATPEGRKELVGFQVGVRESAQSWRELLVDVKRGGFSGTAQPAMRHLVRLILVGGSKRKSRSADSGTVSTINLRS